MFFAAASVQFSSIRHSESAKPKFHNNFGYIYQMRSLSCLLLRSRIILKKAEPVILEVAPYKMCLKYKIVCCVIN